MRHPERAAQDVEGQRGLLLEPLVRERVLADQVVRLLRRGGIRGRWRRFACDAACARSGNRSTGSTASPSPSPGRSGSSPAATSTTGPATSCISETGHTQAAHDPAARAAAHVVAADLPQVQRRRSAATVPGVVAVGAS